jgi:phosphoglycolate phosphatase-like HAD superfamily hydrolase
MHKTLTRWLLPLLTCLCLSPLAAAAEPLPSWRDSAARTAIIDFVAAVTDPASSDFVPAAARIAVFDNDGTLWSEQPVYFQLLFAIDAARARIEQDPALAERSPWREIGTGDLKVIAGLGREALLDLVMGTHAGMSEAAFAAQVRAWLESARHPTRGRPYTDMVYQPMLELLDYLRAHDFQTWIVSGGGVSFLRVFAEEVYGIPPEQVVGTRVALAYDNSGEVPRILRRREIAHIDDKAGKPVGIQQAIGRRPILAAGNSDGDFEMLEWTTAGDGLRLGLLLHHTDAEREWAYDRVSPIGRLERGLDEADARGWRIIDMRSDWTRVYPPQP